MKKYRLKEIQQPGHKAAGSGFEHLAFHWFVFQFVTKGKDFMTNIEKQSQCLQLLKRKATYGFKKPLPTQRSSQNGASMQPFLLRFTGGLFLFWPPTKLSIYFEMLVHHGVNLLALCYVFISLKAHHSSKANTDLSYSWQKHPRFAMDTEAADNNPEPLYIMNLFLIHTFLWWYLIYKSCKIRDWQH